MNAKEFMDQLKEVQKLMNLEKYKEAIIILDKLKELEKKGEYNFNYSLIHTLYQIDSNCRSNYNQAIILTHIKKISNKQKLISLQELNKIIKNDEELDINEDILRREVELLILRNLITGVIKKDSIILKSS
ncbi:MAG: hypothetical protein ACFFB0_01875 [Promethearchaeota archaeon]